MASFNQSVDENKQNGKRKWNESHTDIDRNSKEDEDDHTTTGKLNILLISLLFGKLLKFDNLFILLTMLYEFLHLPYEVIFLLQVLICNTLLCLPIM